MYDNTSGIPRQACVAEGSVWRVRDKSTEYVEQNEIQKDFEDYFNKQCFCLRLLPSEIYLSLVKDRVKIDGQMDEWMDEQIYKTYKSSSQPLVSLARSNIASTMEFTEVNTVELLTCCSP